MFFYLLLQNGQGSLERGVGLRLILLILIHDLDSIVVLLLLDVKRSLLGQFDKILHNPNLTRYSTILFLMPLIISKLF